MILNLLCKCSNETIVAPNAPACKKFHLYIKVGKKTKTKQENCTRLTYSASIRSSSHSNESRVCRVQPHDPIVYTQLLAKVLHYLLLLFRSLWCSQPLMFPDSLGLRRLSCPHQLPSQLADRTRTLQAVSTMSLDLALMTSTRVHKINEMFPETSRKKRRNYERLLFIFFYSHYDGAGR